MTAKTVDPAILNAWYVVHGFVNAVNICVCGTVDDAIHLIYETLGRYPKDAPDGWGRPGTDPQSIFAAVVLDSWDLITHGGSLDSGAVRTDKGEVLYQAMRTLTEAGEPLLPDVWQRGGIEGWEPPDAGVPWWTRADVAGREA